MIVSRAILFAGFFILLSSGYSYAQCTSASGSTVAMYWDANSESDIDYYNVHRSSTAGSGYSLIGTIPQSPTPVSLIDMTPLSTGYYVVTAVNIGGLGSGFSNELCVQLSGGTTNSAPAATDDSASTSEGVGDGGKARGLTQLWVSTARQYGDVTPEQLHLPETNISFSFKHFRHLLKKYRGNLALALYAWNRGAGKVDKLLIYGESPQNGYAKKIYEAALLNNRDWLLTSAQ